MNAQHSSTDVDELSARMFGTIGRFRRGVRRSSGLRFPGTGEGVTAAQAEFLRFVGRHPGATVGEAAAHLGLAANTVSTLVSATISSGLVSRTQADADRRVGVLTLTDEAQQRADAARESRRDAVATALESLSAEDRWHLEAGLGIIDRLTEKLGEVHP